MSRGHGFWIINERAFRSLQRLAGRWVIAGRVIEREHPVELLAGIGRIEFALAGVGEFADYVSCAVTRIEPAAATCGMIFWKMQAFQSWGAGRR